MVSQPRTSRGAVSGANGLGVNTSFMSSASDPGPASFQSYFEQSVGRISRGVDTNDALNTHSDILEELEEYAQEQRQRREQRAEADRERSQRISRRRASDLEQAADITRIDEQALSIVQESLRETLSSTSEETEGRNRAIAGHVRHAGSADDEDRREISEDDAERVMRAVQRGSDETSSIDELAELLGADLGEMPEESLWPGGESVSDDSLRLSSGTESAESEHAVSLQRLQREEAVGRSGAETRQDFVDALGAVAEDLEEQLESLEDDDQAYREVVEELHTVLEKMERRRDPEETADALEMLADLIESVLDPGGSAQASEPESTELQQGAEENAELGGLSGLGELLGQSLEQDARSVSRSEIGENVRSASEANGQLLVDAIERLVSRLTGSTSGDRESAAGSDKQPEGGAVRLSDEMNGFASHRGLETAAGDGRPEGNEAERLVHRLREISEALRNPSESRESEGAVSVEARARERSERAGELVIDVRDRRTRNERSSNRHRESKNGAERTAMRSDSDQRSERDGQAADYRRAGHVQRAAQNSGEEDSRSAMNAGSGQARSSGREADAIGEEARTGGDRFERLLNTGAESTPGERSARATGGNMAEVRSGPSSHSAELARTLREQGNADIVRQARVILRDENSGELRLRLKPEGLGNVRIYMELDDKRVDMRILVENSSVRETFRQNIAELQRAFEADGFTTGSFSVDIEGENAGNMSGNRQENGEADSESQGSNASRGVHELEDAVPPLEAEYEHERHVNVMA